jgi:hypothetical protein
MKINTTSLAQGKIEKGSSALQIMDNGTWVSYSTTVAKVDNVNRILYATTIRYSNTTSKQMCWVKRYYERRGYTIQPMV